MGRGAWSGEKDGGCGGCEGAGACFDVSASRARVVSMPNVAERV